MRRVFLQLICLAVAANAVAQSKMYVRQKDGSTVSFDVNDIVEINFTDSDAETKTVIVNGVSFKMKKVEAGTFTMGAKEDDPYGEVFKEIPHQVTLTKDFYIAETECTQELWAAVMGNNPSRFKGEQYPVDGIEWDNAQAFISKINELTGEHFRLPTEAEWEYAAKGGNKSKGYLYAGADSLNDIAWYAGNAVFEYNKPGYGTHPVATKEPNELGLYDMSGSVWEWCEDSFSDYTAEDVTDPLAKGGRPYVFRGGGWDFNDYYCRVSHHMLPGNRYYDVGLRLCLTIEK
ncbi:MAG: formylglycine-generating enzyme family protein [Paludibacteraceae bacterium]|nr:formylglycine-generating enzyme family protein [Paludibacteraceae bacterium]